MRTFLNTTTLSNKQARNLVIQAQQLNQKSRNLNEVIHQLGYVQIDTIAVVNRAHHHILWTRFPKYKFSHLCDLQTNQRSIFEYWGHAMSYLPMTDYRFALPKMKNFENPSDGWAKRQYEKSKDILESVLARIREEGPLSSLDFEHTGDNKGGTWWDWKPAKIALEYLFWRGDLMITQRQQFRKVYDLKERVIPDYIDTSFPSDEDIGRYIVYTGLKALGIATVKELMHFLQPGTGRDSDIQLADKKLIQRTVHHGMEQGNITQVKIEKESSDNFVLTSRLETSMPLKKQIHILSPFDNLIIQRQRLKRLFGFDYTLECYLPEAKRKYGYFTLPILFGNSFIGRMDCKAERKAATLLIKNLIFEEHIKCSETLSSKLAKKLNQFAIFNGCDKVKLSHVSPSENFATLEAAIKDHNKGIK